MARKSKNRKRKIWRKELKASWAKGAHKAAKADSTIPKKELFEY